VNYIPRKVILALVLPGLSFLTLLLFAPIFILFVNSFFSEGTLSLTPYIKTISQSVFKIALFRTLRVGSIVSGLTILLGYPTAYVISKMSSRKKAVFMSLALFPLMTTAVVRTFGWFVILGRHGIINRFVTSIGLFERPLKILYTEPAIILGLTHLFFPLMLLSLLSSLENVPEGVEEAAQSLGAHPLRSFLLVIVPLTMDGLILGVTLVFTGCITAYTTPAILGGTRVLTLSTLLYQRAMTLMDWESATVIAVVLLFVAITVNAILRLVKARRISQ
jgi:putative spermidine/putrescine transport system permease protein